MKANTIVLLLAVIICIFLPGSAYQSNYFIPVRFCYQPLEVGPCRAVLIRYGYNLEKRTCTNFVYGGCRGNGNNFRTLEECQKVCDKQILLPRS